MQRAFLEWWWSEAAQLRCYQGKKSNAALFSLRLKQAQGASFSLLTFPKRGGQILHWCHEGWRRKWHQPLPRFGSWRHAFSSGNGRLERNKEGTDETNFVERQHCSAIHEIVLAGKSYSVYLLRYNWSLFPALTHCKLDIHTTTTAVHSGEGSPNLTLL